MWFYDFKDIAEFDDAAFETYYESVKSMLKPDVSNLGFRVVRDGADIMLSPLLLTELRFLMFNKYLLENGADLELPDTHPAILLALRTPGVRHNRWNTKNGFFERPLGPYEKLNEPLRDAFEEFEILKMCIRDRIWAKQARAQFG